MSELKNNKKAGKSASSKRLMLMVAAIFFVLLGLALVYRPKNNRSSSDSKKPQDVSFSEVCKNINTDKLKDVTKASELSLKEDSVTRTETPLYVQNACNLIVEGDATVKGYVNVIVQEFKDSAEKDNQKLQVETFWKSVKGSERVEGLGDVAYLSESDAGSRIVVAKNGKRLTVIYPLASGNPADKEKLKEVAKEILSKI
jgi:hypothetical protein